MLGLGLVGLASQALMEVSVRARACGLGGKNLRPGTKV